MMKYLNRLNDFIQTLDNVERVEILPFTHLVPTNGKSWDLIILSKGSIHLRENVWKMQKKSCTVRKTYFKK